MNTIKLKSIITEKTYLSASVFRTGYTILKALCKTINQFIEFLILYAPIKLNKFDAYSGFVW